MEWQPVGNLPDGDLTAAHVARSLLTGGFEPAGDDQATDDADGCRTLAATADGPDEPDATRRRRPPSSRRRNRSRRRPRRWCCRGGAGTAADRKRRKPSYWQSVASIGVQVAEALEYAHHQGVCTATSSRRTCCSTRRGRSGWPTSGWPRPTTSRTSPTPATSWARSATCRRRPSRARPTRAGDVYSLGLTLYELLAFRAAFDEKERNRLIKQVTHAEPARLSKVNRAVPRDLETIVHKAIDREPGQRYQRAADLAADLHRFLDDEPIQARRTSPPERLARWCRRNPVVAGLTAALAVVFLAGFAGVTWKWREAERQTAIAQTAERKEAVQRAIAVEQRDEATAPPRRG